MELLLYLAIVIRIRNPMLSPDLNCGLIEFHDDALRIAWAGRVSNGRMRELAVGLLHTPHTWANIALVATYNCR